MRKHKQHWIIEWLFRRGLWLPLLLVVAVSYMGHTTKVAQVATVEAQVAQIQAVAATQQLQQVTVIARVATASAKPIFLTDAQAKTLIAIVIPDKPAQTRFFNIVKHCENSTLNPTRININKDGSFDLGFFQINSVHRKEVEVMFGESFEAAMKDESKNLLYAAYLYSKQGFTPWVCARYIKS